MTTFLAYVWAPLLMTLLALGLGLLVERLTRWSLPAALLAPAGAAAAIPVTMTIFRLHGTGLLAAGVVTAGAVAGIALARHQLRHRLRPGWAGAAAVGAGLLYIGPCLLTGAWSWAGYNFVNDTSLHLLYADLLTHHGFTLVGGPPSTTTVIQTSGVTIDYPMGVHALLATLWPLAGIDAAPLYQPLIATTAAGAAAALTQLARRAGAPGPAAALIAVLALGGNLLYQQAQHGAVKEIVMVLLLVTAAALVSEALVQELRAGFGVLFALPLASTFLVFSVAGAPYALFSGVFALLALPFARPRPVLRQIAIATASAVLTALAATAAVLADVVSFGRGAATTFESSGPAAASTAQFGQLLRPLPAYQAAGVWLGEDYRLPLPPGSTATIQTVLIVLVLALTVVGATAQLGGRRFGAPLLLATCGMTAIVAAPRVAPYADAKLLLLLTPAVVFVAGLGIWQVARLRLKCARAVAALLALACGGGVVWSDALAAHETRLAPIDRMQALHDATGHTGGGYWLMNEWEEYAKYFLRSIRSNSGEESYSPDVVVLRRPVPIFGQYFDLDEQTLEYLQRFDGIIVRRSPVASRPPGDFRRVYANSYYELWRRDRATEVREHVPLGGLYDPAARPRCGAVRALARRARQQDSELLAAPRTKVAAMDVIDQADRPAGWVPNPNRPRMVTMFTPGRETGTIRVPEAGRYRVWLQLSSGRPLEIRIDGHWVGSPHQVNTPEQYLEAGELRLAAGTHRVELRRAGGRPWPGDGYDGEVGPLVLEPVEPQSEPRRVKLSDAEQLCKQRWDWIEVVAQ